jgi:predicted metalloprotease with PDZ domain
MKKTSLMAVFVLLLAAALMPGAARRTDGNMRFTVSMENPHRHYYHVALRCEGLPGRTLDFKMPAWTPGFYLIMDYARHVLNFSAADGKGNPLPWEKTEKNTWRVHADQATAIAVSYDVYAFGRSVAESYLDDERGFISPTSLFMHVAGRLRQPATVTIKPFSEWRRVETALDPSGDQENTFSAPDFDVLYDSPILIGNQEALRFDVGGVPHVFVASDLGSLDREKLVSDLKLIVQAATGIFREIPYPRYAFLAIGPGQGGLEHMNSVAFTFNAAELSDAAGYKKWLRFMAHEFFHLFNVKRIRPLALGPFDYDRENYTRMLWVSEGFSVYYEDLVLNRAGLLGRDEVLEHRRDDIAGYENTPGRHFQSAAASSFDIWCNFLNWGGNAANTTISYYDKGAALALLLDLKIRHETGNRRALDDVMRSLYGKFHKQKGRGFSDGEFRRVCEEAAGCPLAEFFSYAETVQEIDYRKYLAYAGLDIDVSPKELPGAFLGAVTREQDGKLVIAGVERDSPAWQGSLSIQDELLALDGFRADPGTWAAILAQKKPGDKIRIMVARHDRIREFDVVLGKKTERSFLIKPLANPDPLQSVILKDWLR